MVYVGRVVRTRPWARVSVHILSKVTKVTKVRNSVRKKGRSRARKPREPREESGKDWIDAGRTCL